MLRMRRPKVLATAILAALPVGERRYHDGALEIVRNLPENE
jgi:hypothetical protein